MRGPIAIVVCFCGLVASCRSLDSKRDRQLDYAKELEPAPFDQPVRFRGPPKKLRARAYLENEYARTTLEWQRRLAQQVERSNEILIPGFGVELDIVDVVPWASKRSTSSLGSALEELTQLDAGSDVELVIGLVGAESFVTPSVHHLGMARLLGKHLVLRGMDDALEYASFREVFSRLDDDERERLYRLRRRHKETSVLLHELGHAWGAIHDGGPHSLMVPQYDRHVCRFSEWNTGIIDRVLAGLAFAEGTPDRKAVAADIARFVETSTNADWIGKDRALALTLLRGPPEKLARATDEVFDPEPPPSDRPDRRAAPRPELSPDAQAVKDALDRARADDFESAWTLLGPVADRNKDDQQIQSYACQIEARIESRKGSAIGRCRAAAEASPFDPLSALTLAHLLSDDRARAWPWILESERRLEQQATPDASAYASIASLYRVLKAPTRALRAAEKADEEAQRETRAWAEALWAGTGIGPDSLLASEDEPELFELRYAIDAHLAARDLRAAVLANAELRRKFPMLPGAEIALCQEHLRAKMTKVARRYCVEATQLEPNNDYPHQTLGVLALSEGRPRLAIEPFERALALAPDKKPNWLLLHSAYRAGGLGTKAVELANRYREKFGSPMPPH